MVSRESIQEQFELLGTVPSNVILDKCVELCASYGLHDPEEFVEQWVAFSVSNLGGAEPTLEYLRQMERKEFNKKDNTVKKIKEAVYINTDIPSVSDTSSCNLYSTDVNIAKPYGKEEKTYKAGAVVCTFGKLSIEKNATWVNNNKCNVDIQQIPNKNGEYLDSNALYMFDNLMDKCAIIGDHMYNIGEKLCDKYLTEDKENILDENLSLSEIKDISITSEDVKMSENIDLPTTDYSQLSYANVSGQDMKKCIGRVFCDADARLNSSSVMIHSTDDQATRTCHLNFSNLQSYDMYPGQICMVKGRNPRGNTIFVQDIKTDLPLPKPNITTIKAIDGPLHILVASGPFTPLDNLSYQPFKDLTSYIKQNQPNVVILLGPFIEPQNQHVIEGDLKVTFTQLVESLLLDLMEAIGNTTTKILVVASSRDAISAEVYPTPPYKLFTKTHKPNLLLLPDPCTLNIQGILMTLTTTDIMKHMQEEELAQNVSRDMVKRCVRRIFYQRTMYPIYPPSYEVSLDTNLWSRFCQINSIPHIMILPSDNKYYTRDIDGCITLNPGKLVTGTITGTFSRFVVHPCVGNDNWFEKIALQTVKI